LIGMLWFCGWTLFYYGIHPDFPLSAARAATASLLTQSP